MDGAGSIRVQSFASGIACYVAPLFPSGLDDPTPTVLGVRTIPATANAGVDVTLTLGDFSAALERVDPSRRELFLSEGDQAVWTAITPPRDGWEPLGTVSAATHGSVLASGLAEVSEGAGGGLAGAIAVHKLRGLVWGRPTPSLGGMPAGAVFALDGLGFVAEETPVTVFRSGPWFRAAASFGDVIARTRPSLLSSR